MSDFVTCECGNEVRVEGDPERIPVKCPACGEVINPPGTLEEQDDFDRLIGGDTVASNPGRMRVQGLFYCRCFPRVPLAYAATLLGSVALAVFCHYVFWAATVLCLLGLLWWPTTEEHGGAAFLSCCSSAGALRVGWSTGSVPPSDSSSHAPDEAVSAAGCLSDSPGRKSGPRTHLPRGASPARPAWRSPPASFAPRRPPRR